MSQQPKLKILIISYRYYPSKAIGARRWLKFGQEMIRKGHDVSILSTNNGGKLNENHYFFQSKYPTKTLGRKLRNFVDKLRYNFWIRVLPFFTGYNFYDLAVFDKKNVIQKAKEIINSNGINIIITTGAPFSLCYYSTELKKENPHLKIINDFRDPWTWNNRYGFELISNKKRNRENHREKQVIELSDYVFVPVKPMEQFLVKKYAQYADKIKIVPHFFEVEKMPQPSERNSSKSTLDFIYGGSIYPGTMDWYEEFAQVISEGSIESRINLYSQNHTEDKTSESGLISLKKGIDEQELFENINNADYYFACYPEIEKDFISTKFYEIIYLKTPIVLIAPKGILSDFIVSNNLGVHILPDEISESLKLLVSFEKNNKYNENFDVTKYKLPAVTDQVIKYIG